MSSYYDFQAIEKKWQKYWDDNRTFHAEIDHSKPKFYPLVEFPYPSGAGLHVGPSPQLYRTGCRREKETFGGL